MNKKIKVIELLNKIYANLDVPKRLKKNDYIFEYCEEEQDFYNVKKCTYLICDYAQSHEKWLDVEVEILEDEEDNDISSLNAFKLMDAPYMAKCLDKNSHEEFMEHLKQSEVEIVHKIRELIEKVNKLDKKINKENDNA